MKKPDKTEIYKHGNFSVSTYDFTIPNGEKSGQILKRVELKTVKKQWAEGADSYYKQTQYITISEEQLARLIQNLGLTA